MTGPRLPEYVVKWSSRCGWCGGPLVPGDLGSYSTDELPVHLECRRLEA